MTEDIINTVSALAMSFSRSYDLDPDSTEDLRQEALLEACEAAAVYEEGDAALGTYCYNRALLRVRNWLAERQYSPMPIPRRVGEALRQAGMVTARLQQELLREPTNAEIAAAMDLTPEQFQHVRTEGLPEMEDFGSEEDEAGEALGAEDVVADTGAVFLPTEAKAEYDELRADLYVELGKLTEEEAAVVRAAMDGDDRTRLAPIRDVAEAIGLSRMTAKRRMESALAKLRHRLSDRMDESDFELPMRAGMQGERV